jgi:hypothetical protein
VKPDTEKKVQAIRDAFEPFKKNPADAFLLASAPWFDIESEKDERLIDPLFKKP